MIEINNLEYQIDGKLLFDDANLYLPNGHYQLCGSNGVGKTTLLEIITRQITKGYYGSTSVPKSTIYITQKPLLFDNCSVLANVRFFNKCKQKDILETLEAMNINKSALVSTLSGGQCQLVYLLIFLNKPSNLYLIDEPFNNLDKKHTAYITELINNLENIVVIDHQNHFDFQQVIIENRGIKCNF